MPIHVTTSTTQSLSNKTFVDRVSTTGVVFASSGNSNQWSSAYTTVSATSGRYITNVISNTQGALSCIRLGDTFTVNTGLTVSATPTFEGLIVNYSGLTAYGSVKFNGSLTVGSLKVSNYTLPGGEDEDNPPPYSRVMKLPAGGSASYYAAWSPDLGENVYNYVNSISGNLILGQLGITIDGAGSVITPGVKQYLRVPYNCTITSAEIVADITGSIIIDIYKSTYANFPPTSSIIVGSENRPTLNNALTYKNTTLTGWNTTLSAGEYIGFYVDTVNSVKKITLTLVTRR
jgi:hypothetical protein